MTSHRAVGEAEPSRGQDEAAKWRNLGIRWRNKRRQRTAIVEYLIGTL